MSTRLVRTIGKPFSVMLNLFQHLLPGRYIRRLSPQKRLWVNILAVCIVILFGTWALSSLLTAGKAEAAWFNDNWAYRKAILFTHTAVETNVYLNLSGANALDTSTAGKFQSDCGDLRFTDANGKLLPYYLVSGCGTSTTVVHIFFSSMPAGDQYIYEYYGNPSITNGTKSADFTTGASGITFNSVGSEESTPGTLLEWKLDEGYGTTTKDSTANGNAGTLTNSPTWQDPTMCVSGKCLQFNGTNNYVVSTTNISCSYSRSVSVWFRGYSTGSPRTIFEDSACGGRFLVYYNNNKTITLYPDNAATPFSGSQTFAEGQWHFLTITMNKINGTQSTASIYVDGVLQATATNTYGTSGSAKLYVGSTGTPNNYFKGNLDDLTYYNYTRTLTQIKQAYAAGLQQMAQQQGNLGNGLVGYWKMDEASWNGTAGEVKDYSGSGLNGQAINGANTTTGKFGNAGNFATSTSYVNAGNNIILPPTQGRSAGFWIYPNSAENWAGVFVANIGNDLGSIMYWGTSGQLNSRLCFNSNLSYAIPVPNQWNYVAFSYDPVLQKEYAYLNGVRTQTIDRTGQTCGTYTAHTMYIGGLGATNNLDGRLDDLRYYNRSLSAPEIQQLYNFGPPPMAQYNFEETTGTTYHDITGNGNDFTAAGGKYRISGKYGFGDSIASYRNRLATSATIITPPNITLSAWIEPSVLAFGDIAGTCQLEFSLQADGSLRLRIKDGGGSYYYATTSANVFTTSDLNKWTYVSVAYDGTTARLFKNGIMVGSVAMTAVPDQTPNTFNGGYDCNSYFTGGLDEISIYNYARTPSQIIQDMNGGHPLGGSPVGSEALWLKMDEGSGTTVHNSGSGGSALDATANKALWTSGKFGKAMNFDLTNFISLATGSALPIYNDVATGYSVSFWVKGAPQSDYIYTESSTSGGVQNFLIGTSASGKITLYIRNDAGGYQLLNPSSTFTALDNTWHQVVWTDNNGTASLYVDGKKDATNFNYTASGTHTFDTATIGARINPGVNNLFNGQIDDFKIYTAVLTADQVKIDYTRNSSLVLGSTGTESDGKTPSNSSDRSYCPPGDTTGTCGPVGEWKFEEGYGTSVADTSGNGNNGTWGGTGSHWTSGKIGNAGSFDGTDDNVDAGNGSSFSFTSGATLEAWVYLTGTQGGFIINKWVNAAEDKRISIDSSQKVHVYFYTGVNTSDLISTAAVPLYTWTHVVGSYDGSQLAIYINGRLDSTLSKTGTISNSSGHLYLGMNPVRGGATNPFLGRIDQARVYNYARSAAQIAWDYNRGAPVARYKLDECEGTTVHSSTTPYDPTLNGTITIGSGGTQTAVGTCQTSGTAWGNGASGKYNASLNFDGTDDYVNIAHQSVLDSMPLTVSAWFKFTGNGLRGIVNKYVSASSNGYQIFQFGGNICAWYYVSSGVNISGGGATCPFNVSGFNDGNWHLATFTVDTTGGKLYLDGVLKGSLGWTGTPAVTTTTQNLHIGDYPVSGGENNYFNGQIDDVQIFNYALTVQQVKNLYNNSSAIYFGP